MLVVLDTSVSLTWLLHNGTSQQNDLADRALYQAAKELRVETL